MFEFWSSVYILLHITNICDNYINCCVNDPAYIFNWLLFLKDLYKIHELINMLNKKLNKHLIQIRSNAY